MSAEQQEPTHGRLVAGADLEEPAVPHRAEPTPGRFVAVNSPDSTPVEGTARVADPADVVGPGEISIKTIQDLAFQALQRMADRENKVADQIEARWAEETGDQASIAGAVDPDDLILTSVLQAVGEPVGAHATHAPVPTQGRIGVRATYTTPLHSQHYADRDPTLHAAFLATTRAALADLLRHDGFRSATFRGAPVIEHPTGVRVRVSTSGIYLSFDDVVAASLKDTTAGALPSVVRRVLHLDLSNLVPAVAAAAAGLAAICGDPRTVPVAGRVGRDQVDELMRLVEDFGTFSSALGTLIITKARESAILDAEAVVETAKRAVRDRLNQLLFPTPDGTLGG